MLSILLAVMAHAGPCDELCASEGRCDQHEDGRCVASTDEQCAGSAVCKSEGDCLHANGECTNDVIVTAEKGRGMLSRPLVEWCTDRLVFDVACSEEAAKVERGFAVVELVAKASGAVKATVQKAPEPALSACLERALKGKIKPRLIGETDDLLVVSMAGRVVSCSLAPGYLY